MTLLTLWMVLACGHAPEDVRMRTLDEGPPLEVSTVTVRSAPMPSVVELTGTVVADRQTQVAADTNGVVVETRFERGDRVRKGDVLAVVDTKAIQMNAAAGAAQADAQRAQLDAAERECVRAEQLLADAVISRSQYERTMAGCEAQRQAVAAASASAAAASALAQQTRIRAPFDGVVGERLVDVGAFVASPVPVATLYADTGLRVRISVPESQLPLVELGAPVRVAPTALPERVYTGVVRSMSGALREPTRDVVLEAVLDDADMDLRPGMFARVQVDAAARDTLVVPADAVVTEGTVHRVFVVREGRAFEVVVRVGLERDGLVAVLTDLTEGDEVVGPIPDGLRDGRRVE